MTRLVLDSPTATDARARWVRRAGLALVVVTAACLSLQWLSYPWPSLQCPSLQCPSLQCPSLQCPAHEAVRCRSLPARQAPALTSLDRPELRGQVDQTKAGGPASAAAPAPASGEPTWMAVAQQAMGSHRRPEPTWKTAFRRVGAWPWVALFCLPIPFAFARMRARGMGPPQVVMLVISALLFALAGVLTARVIGRIAAPPIKVRGRVTTKASPPPPGQRAVYAWGDSTMHGDVFAPRLTIPRVVQWATAGRGDPLSVQNLARPGAHLQEWRSSALAQVLAAPARYRPAAVLVYVGHNGYPDLLEHRWVGEDSAKLRDNIEATFARELRALADRVRAAGATLIIGLPVANTEGHPPPGPRHAESVSLETQAAYEAAVDLAEAASASGDHARALSAIRAARRLSPSHAWAPFVEAQLLRRLGRDEAARAAFVVAHELDLDRQRSLPSQEAIIRSLCGAGLATCVDAAAALRREFPWLDDAAFIDLHHPVARGHLLIGHAFARALSRALHRPPPRSPPVAGVWPPALDPGAQMRERYLQTASWYMQLARKHRGGYERSFRDALARGRRCLVPLAAYERGLKAPHRALFQARLKAARAGFARLE